MKAEELLEEMARAAYDVKNADVPEETRDFLWTYDPPDDESERQIATEEVTAALRVFVERTGWHHLPGGGIAGTHMDFEETVALLLALTTNDRGEG